MEGGLRKEREGAEVNGDDKQGAMHRGTQVCTGVHRGTQVCSGGCGGMRPKEWGGACSGVQGEDFSVSSAECMGACIFSSCIRTATIVTTTAARRQSAYLCVGHQPCSCWLLKH